MAFSFGFSGDDIDIDDTELNNEAPVVTSAQGTTNSLPELVKANKHDMNEWVSFFWDRSDLYLESIESYSPTNV